MGEKRLTRSILDQIQGIGEKRKKLLYLAFQSLDELRNTPVDVLARMEGMNRSAAERVHEFLNRLDTHSSNC